MVDRDNAAQTFPVFLGLAERVLRRSLRWDLLGLTTTVFLPCFPQRLDGLALCLAIPATENPPEAFKVELREEGSLANSASTELHFRVMEATTAKVAEELLEDYSTPARTLRDVYSDEMPMLLAVTAGEAAYFIPIPCPPLLVWQPCRVLVNVVVNGERRTIGSFTIGFVQTPPISPEERSTLLGELGGYRYLRFVASCPKCSDKLYLTASLEGAIEAPAHTDGSSCTLDSAPDEWTCKCRETRVPLGYTKLSFHHLFRTLKERGQKSPLTFVPHFEHETLEAIIGKYSSLIRSNPDEEAVQRFMAGHSIVWSFLSYTRIELKPPILTKHKADFAILSSDRTLYFVELEKPQTPLTKVGGGVHSELQRGITQLNDWRRVVRTDQRAVLNELGFRHDEVESIKFILIAGLASTLQPGTLGTIRDGMAPDVTLLTFDDLELRLRRVQRALVTL